MPVKSFSISDKDEAAGFAVSLGVRSQKTIIPGAHVFHENSGATADWKRATPTDPGLHKIVSPENSPCKSVWFSRLNLLSGQSTKIADPLLEQSAAVIEGSVTISNRNKYDTLNRLDSFYLPAREEITVTAITDSVLYIGGARDEGYGSFMIRRFEADLPLGEIRQVHGKAPFRRDVFMTLNQEVPASRLITGLTWGDEGAWTSWPPHQHEKDLEEIYCYFDIPAPSFALHLSYCKPGELESIHPVSSGDCILIPRGYHPTVGMPGVRSCYFWVMAAHSHAGRSYELSMPDPRLSY